MARSSDSNQYVRIVTKLDDQGKSFDQIVLYLMNTYKLQKDLAEDIVFDILE